MCPFRNAEASEVRIQEGDIKVGEPLRFNIYDGRRRLLMRQGNVVATQTQLQALLRRGAYIIMNEEALTGPRLREPVLKRSSFELIDEACSRLEILFLSERTQRSLDAGIFRICRMIQQAVEQDHGASLSTVLWPSEVRYSIKHQVHTAVTCEFILKKMGYSPSERLSVLGASLTMNVAINNLQDLLFFQKEELNDEQKKKIKSHLIEGVEALSNGGIADPLWIETVYQHHEFLDGTGYPRGLKGKDIIEPSRVLTIADIYCAKVTGRAYRRPLPPNLALKEIFLKDRGHSVDLNLSHVFIKELGIYPPGCLVRLANDEIAVVVRQGKNAGSPMVRSLLSPAGKAYLNPRLRDCSEKEFAIREMISREDFRIGINRRRVWSSVE